MAFEGEGVPFRGRRELVKPVSAVRSSVLISSLRSLEERRLRDAYFALLAPEARTPMREMVSGEWVPLPLVIAHYEACDRLDLPGDDQYQMGFSVAQRITGGLVGTLVRAARAAGLTPGMGLRHYRRLWDRLMMGGDVGTKAIGPRDVALEIIGLPLARIRYFRNAFRGLQHGCFALFAGEVHVSEIASLCTSDALGFRIVWS